MSQNESNDDPIAELDKKAAEIVQLRKRSLLILYYPDMYGWIREEDVKDLYDEFRRRGRSRNNQKYPLDVLIHTFGGNPIAAYRIAQVIRDFARDVTFLVPEFAYSGGTLACLAGNEIRLGAYAALSPIDVTLGTSERGEGVQLLNVDYFMEFVSDCREKIERMLKENNVKAQTNVDSELLTELTRQVGALDIGLFFRERTLTGHYAERLLNDYMLIGDLNKRHLTDAIVHSLLFEMPSHGFSMDYHICKEIKLPVTEMDEHESDMTKELVNILGTLTRVHVVCRDIGKDYKMPFFRLYDGGDKVGNGTGTKES